MKQFYFEIQSVIFIKKMQPIVNAPQNQNKQSRQTLESRNMQAVLQKKGDTEVPLSRAPAERGSLEMPGPRRSVKFQVPSNYNKKKKPNAMTEVTLRSSSSEKYNKKEHVEDIFRLSLERMPSIVDELVRGMKKDDKEAIRMELGVSRDDLSEEEIEKIEPTTTIAQSPKRNSPISKCISPAQSSCQMLGDSVYSQSELRLQLNLIESPTHRSRINKNLPPDQTKSTKTADVIPYARHDITFKEASINRMVRVTQVDSEQEKVEIDSDEMMARQMRHQMNIRLSQLVNEVNDDTLHTTTSRRSKRSNFTKSPPNRARSFQRVLTIEQLADLLLKPHKERSDQDNEDIHNYMISNIKFFMPHQNSSLNTPASKAIPQASGPVLSNEDKKKMYEVMQYKTHNQGDVLCEYMAKGDRFYILLEGQVGVRVPTKLERNFNTTWDVYSLILQEFETIRQCFDTSSKESYGVIKIIGVATCRDLRLNKVVNFIDLLTRCIKQEELLTEKWPNLDMEKIRKEKKFITTFLQKLIDQNTVKRRLKPDSSSEATATALTSFSDLKQQQPLSPDKKQFKVKLQIMEHVNQLNSGDSFGQDALINETPRNATCYVMTESASTAVLTKNDFRRVLLERERQRVDHKIAQILRFDLFKYMTKRRLKNIYRIFFNAKNMEPYVAARGQYLYRQGDPVDGIYCILDGNVKSIKETWNDMENLQTQTCPVYEDDVQMKKRPISLVDEIKRNKAKQIVLTIIKEGETIGVEEIVMKLPWRKRSMQVSGNKNCTYLFLSAKNFKEKFFNTSHSLKHVLCEKLELQQQLYDNLEAKKTTFQCRNAKPNQAGTNTKTKVAGETLHLRPDNPFNKKLSEIEMSLNKPQTIKEIVAYTNQKNSIDRKSSIMFVSEPLPQKEEIAPPSLVWSAAMIQSQKVKAVPIVQGETVIEKLDKQIQSEIEKAHTNVNKLVQHMRERRHEIVQELKEKSVKNELQHKDLSSVSQPGKTLEQTICRQFKAVHENQRDKRKMSKESQKISIEVITTRLVKETSGMASMWKNERQKEESANLMLQSLTTDKRIQKSISNLGHDKLPFFLEYLREQGFDYMRKLNVPVFEGSLLLNKEKETDSKSNNTTHIRGTLVRNGHVVGDVTGDRASQQSLMKENKSKKIDNSPKTVKSINAKPNSASIQKGLTRTYTQWSRVKSAISKNDLNPSRSPSRLSRSPSKRSKSGSRRNASPLLDASGDKLDLMKVYLNWLQYYQSTFAFQQKRQKQSLGGRKSSAEVISERAKLVTEKIMRPATKTERRSTQQSAETIGQGERKPMRRAQSQFIPSGILSAFSMRSMSRIDGVLSPEQVSQSKIHFKKNSAREKVQYINRTVDLIKTEKESISDNASGSPKVNFKQQVHSQQSQLSKREAEKSPHSQTRRITSHRAQQSKWLRTNTAKNQSKKNYKRQIAVPIPEEQYRASIVESEARISSVKRKIIAIDESPERRYYQISPIVNPLTSPLVNNPLTQTEPQTQKHASNQIKFHSGGQEPIFSANPFAFSAESTITPGVPDSRPSESNLSEKLVSLQQNQAVVLLGGHKNETEYLVNIQSLPNQVQGQKKAIVQGFPRSGAISSLNLLPNPIDSKVGQYRPSVQSAREFQGPMVIESDAAKRESLVSHPLEYSIGNQQKIESTSIQFKPVTAESMLIVFKQKMDPAQFIISRVPSQNLRRPGTVAGSSIEDFNGAETKAKTGTSAGNTVGFNSQRRIMAQSEYFVSAPQSSKKVRELQLHGSQKLVPTMLKSSQQSDAVFNSQYVQAPPVSAQKSRKSLGKISSQARLKSWISPITQKIQADKMLPFALFSDKEQLARFKLKKNKNRGNYQTGFEVEKSRQAQLDEIIGLNNKHQVKGFIPTTKVFVSQANPRFSYESSAMAIPNPAVFNLNSDKSEANFSRPKKGRSKLTKAVKLDSVAQGAGSQKIQTGTSTPKQSKAHAMTTGLLNNQSKRILRVQSSEQIRTLRPVSSQFSKKMSNQKVKGNWRNQHLHLQFSTLNEGRFTNKLQVQSKEFQKFTDRMIQDLQMQVQKVQSSSRGFGPSQETKPQLLGSLSTVKISPSNKFNKNFVQRGSIGPNHYLYDHSIAKGPDSVRKKTYSGRETPSEKTFTRNLEGHAVITSINPQSVATVSQSQRSRFIHNPQYI